MGIKLAIALAIALGFTAPQVHQESRQETGYKHLIARLESMPPTPPPSWEVAKFRTTQARAEVLSVKLLAAHVRDPLHRNRRVDLIGVVVRNQPRVYAKMRFKLLGCVPDKPVVLPRLLGVSFGFVLSKTTTWENVEAPGKPRTRTIYFVLRVRGANSYCVKWNGHRKCSD